MHCVFSFIRTVTVGSGIAPDLLTSSLSARGLGIPLTAGGEFRPALRIFFVLPDHFIRSSRIASTSKMIAMAHLLWLSMRTEIYEPTVR